MSTENSLSQLIRKNNTASNNNQQSGTKSNTNFKPPLTTNYSDQQTVKAKMGNPIVLNENENI